MPEIELKPITVDQPTDDKAVLIEVPAQSTLPTSATNPNAHYQRVVAVVAFYIVTSITMIMVNKTVLNQVGLPMTFLWGQLVMAVVLLHVAERCRLLQLPPLNRDVVHGLRYLVGMNVVGLALNTLCLQNIDAALYQVARSLILPMTAIISIYTNPGSNQKAVSKRVAMACSIITVGFLVGVLGERQVTVSTIGIIFGVLSSAATAIHSFAIKHSFSQVPHNGAFDMVYYNNLFSSVLLLPIVMLESPLLIDFMRTHNSRQIWQFLFGTLLAGASGLLINLAGFLQIKVTSPLTHTVSSAARGVLQTVACRVFLGEAVTMARVTGILVTLLGSGLYSWFKSTER